MEKKIIEGKLGPLFIYRNILCMPAQEIYTFSKDNKKRILKGGPVWPDWDEKPVVRHYKGNPNEPIDTKPDILDPEDTIDELVAWGGVIHQHYGHFIADLCVPRWVPILTKFPDMTFLFIIQPKCSLKPWMEELFNYFGIRNYIILKKPAIIRELIAGPQIEIHKHGIYDNKYIEPYLDFLDALAEKKIKPLKGEIYEKIFVSRARLPLIKGHIAGEDYLCECFEKSGFKVIYPEELPVIEQLRIYYNAKTMIFTEGSAIHTLQLLGRIPANVFVINRRKGHRVFKCVPYRVLNFEYIDAVQNDPPKIHRLNPLMPAVINIEVLHKVFFEKGIMLDIDKKEFKKRVICNLRDTIESFKNSKNPFKEKIIESIYHEINRLDLWDDDDKLFLQEITENYNTILSVIRNKQFNENNIKIINEYFERVRELEINLLNKFKDIEVPKLVKLAQDAERQGYLHLSTQLWKVVSEKQPGNIGAKINYALILRYDNPWLSEKVLEECLDYQLKNKILNRTTIIQQLIYKFKYRTYLEIGVARGRNFLQIKAPKKIAVDIKFNIPGGFKNTPNEFYYEVSSDEFFTNPPEEIVKHGIDLAFIDGLHTYEQSLRDVENCLKYLNPGGIIVMHDCLPDSPATAAPTWEEAIKHPEFRGAWTGEVYKTILHLRATRPDLFCAVVNCDWGVGIIKRGKAENMLELSLEEIRKMSFEEFFLKKEQLLNLKPPSWFYEFIEKYSLLEE